MKKLIAANWKMFKTPEEASAYTQEFSALLKARALENREILVFVPAINLCTLAHENKQSALPFMFGVQNFYPAKEGAFTGENSLEAIKGMQATWALVGHSERRSLFNESDEFLADKTEFALNTGYKVCFCVGETLEEREEGKLTQVLKSQLEKGLAKLPASYKSEDLAIAYEPVWAIGTGKVASIADIKEAHALVRELLTQILSNKAQETRILYGGSVKADNAEAILAIDNVDGVLVGGASLQAESFNAIARA